jgi:hypothetical protein
MLVALDLNESASVFEGATANANRQPLMNLYMEQLLPALSAKASYPTAFGAALGGSVNVVGVDNAETSGTAVVGADATY